MCAPEGNSEFCFPSTADNIEQCRQQNIVQWQCCFQQPETGCAISSVYMVLQSLIT